jgi:hypothetical protein
MVAGDAPFASPAFFPFPLLGTPSREADEIQEECVMFPSERRFGHRMRFLDTPSIHDAEGLGASMRGCPGEAEGTIPWLTRRLQTTRAPAPLPRPLPRSGMVIVQPG